MIGPGPSRGRALAAFALLLIAAGFTSASDDAPSADWWARASAEIARSEYAITRQNRGLHAANREQDLRLYFLDGGPEIASRSTVDPVWKLGLELIEAGRAGRTRTVRPIMPEFEEAAVVYRRSSVTERWSNNPAGVRAQLVLPPSGNAGEAEAVFRIDSGLSPLAAADGTGVCFYGDGARSVCVVADAPQTRVRLDEERLVFTTRSTSDEPAELGFRVMGSPGSSAATGVSNTPDWSATGTVIDGLFGSSVATAGDVNGDGYSDMIVGSPAFDNGSFDEGRVFLYLGSPDGPGASPAWTSDGGQSGARHGHSVATAGDVNRDGFDDVIVSADNYNNGETGEGRAYVFHGSTAGLPAAPDWTAEPDTELVRFGRSVSTAGDVDHDGFDDVIIGASFFDAGAEDAGRAFVYSGSAEGLSSVPVWTADGPGALAFFGDPVATAGDVNADGFDDVIVGASGFDNPEIGEGAAFLYTGSASGLSATPAWSAEGNQDGANFGDAVSLAGDLNGDGFGDIVVSAPLYDDVDFNEGRVTAFFGSASGPSLTPDWTVIGVQTNERLGHSVATAGDVNGDGYADLIVGAPLHDNGQNDEGRIAIFLGSGTGPSTTPDWTAESDRSNSEFGDVVAAAGDLNGDGFGDVVVGAERFDVFVRDEGKAFVYFGAAEGLAEIESWSAEGNGLFALFGNAVDTAGDVNGDGFGDVIVGAPLFANGQASEGGAFVFHGSASGLSITPDWIAESDQASAFLGQAVGGAGDVNGDGYDDVIVGAPLFDDTLRDEGLALLYLGSENGLSDVPAWSVVGQQLMVQLGAAVGQAGDVNGDGFGDVLIGVPLFSDGEDGEGQARAYHGSAAGLTATPAWTVQSDQQGAQFGNSVDRAGDVNGDGFGDVIVGASQFNDGRTRGGQASVFFGSDSGLSLEPPWNAGHPQPSARFGVSVATAGDVNGDGYSDVIVGATGLSNGEEDEGAAFVYLGSPAGPSRDPDWAIESDRDDAILGNWVSGAGDVNADGYGDVIVGAALYENNASNEGRVEVYLGSAGGLSDQPDWFVESGTTDGRLGASVSGAGDIDADGASDVIVGASFFSNDESFEGRAFAYHGNDGGGLDRPLAQLRTGDDGRIGLYGMSDSETAFRLRQLARTPAGRGEVRLEWEARALGEPYDDQGFRSGDQVETGFPTTTGSAVELFETADALTAERRFCDDQSACATDADCAGIGSSLCNAEPARFHRWRVRVRTDSPFFPRSPWRSIPDNGITETKLRSAGELPESQFRLVAPVANSVIFPDSLPVRFSWNKGASERFVLEWSRNPDFESVVESTDELQSPGGAFVVYEPDAEEWSRILGVGQSPDFGAAPIFWRVIPTVGGAGGSLEFRVLRVSPATAPEITLPFDGSAIDANEPPAIAWQPNHNDRYRVRFATTEAIGFPRVESGPDFDLTGTSWNVPFETWEQVVELSRETDDGTIYFVLFARDALDRLTFSGVRSLRVVGADQEMRSRPKQTTERESRRTPERPRRTQWP